MPANWEVLSAGLGVLLVVIGLLLRIFMWEPYDLIPDTLGIAIFLISILFYLDKLLKIAEASKLKIDEIKPGFDREPMFATIRPLIASMKSTHDDYIFSSFALTLENIARRYLEATAKALNLAHEDEAEVASLSDIAPVCIFLEELVDSIPVGSVYLGQSLLTSRDAWDGADKYTRWNRLLRDRGKSGEVYICRVWCVSDQKQLQELQG
jgi:hypothetical protein